MAVKESSTNYQNKIGMEDMCPVTLTLSKIGGRWKPVILYHLQEKPLRYGELKRIIPGITEKMFIQQLKELEKDSLVNREVINMVPPQVTYSLSVSGQSLAPILKEMSNWGKKYREAE